MEAANWVNTSATDPRAVTTSAFGPYRQDIVRNVYKDWLPSVNLRYSIDDNKLLRFAVSRTMTRPDYSAIAGAVSLSPPATVGGVGTGSGGNPELEPVLSTNFDATFEWYYGERALLSVKRLPDGHRHLRHPGQPAPQLPDHRLQSTRPAPWSSTT